MDEEQLQTARFMRQATTHISRATDAQKRDLLKVLLNYPPQLTAIDQAVEIWKGLTEKEFMKMCAIIQKQHDKEFWTFATRLRK